MARLAETEQHQQQHQLRQQRERIQQWHQLAQCSGHPLRGRRSSFRCHSNSHRFIVTAVAVETTDAQPNRWVTLHESLQEE